MSMNVKMLEAHRLIKREQTVGFSGPRPGKLPDGGDTNAASMEQLRERLKREIEDCISQGKTTFINGGMSGFDIVAGETVIRMKREYAGIVCITAAPFRAGYFGNTNWTREWKERALNVYRTSDTAFALSETYHSGVYYERNRYLVDHSSVLICYYRGTGGGTKYTLDYARKSNIPIRNIFYG